MEDARQIAFAFRRKLGDQHLCNDEAKHAVAEKFEALVGELRVAIIIVDEAHHFRNQGRQGDLEIGKKRSRYYKFMDLIHEGNPNKKLFMLTATPINNKLTTDQQSDIYWFAGQQTVVSTN